MTDECRGKSSLNSSELREKVARVILFSESKSNREHLLMFRRTCQVGEFVMELSTEEQGRKDVGIADEVDFVVGNVAELMGSSLITALVVVGGGVVVPEEDVMVYMIAKFSW